MLEQLFLFNKKTHKSFGWSEIKKKEKEKNIKKIINSFLHLFAIFSQPLFPSVLTCLNRLSLSLSPRLCISLSLSHSLSLSNSLLSPSLLFSSSFNHN